MVPEFATQKIHKNNKLENRTRVLSWKSNIRYYSIAFIITPKNTYELLKPSKANQTIQ